MEDPWTTLEAEEPLKQSGRGGISDSEGALGQLGGDRLEEQEARR